jgi:hypothetical protein
VASSTAPAISSRLTAFSASVTKGSPPFARPCRTLELASASAPGKETVWVVPESGPEAGTAACGAAARRVRGRTTTAATPPCYCTRTP